MKKTTYAISMTPDQAYYVSVGRIPVIVLSQAFNDPGDNKRFIIHTCNYANQEDRKRGEKRLLSGGVQKDIVPEVAIIATAKANIFEYDEASFKRDAKRHYLDQSSLMVFRTVNEWYPEDKVYGYEFSDIVLMPRPIKPLAVDAEEYMVWEPESPFEELCFKMALGVKSQAEEAA